MFSLLLRHYDYTLISYYRFQTKKELLDFIDKIDWTTFTKGCWYEIRPLYAE